MTATVKMKDVDRPHEMRAEISKMRRENNLIRMVMDVADYAGSTSEDRYTALAYFALQELGRMQRHVESYVLTSMPERIVLKSGESK